MVCLLVAIITYANPNSIVGVNEVEAVVSGSTFRLRNILCLRSCRHKRFDCIRPVEYPPMIAQAIIIIITTAFTGCTQNPISTKSHIWVFVRLYGIVFVIIVIIVIIIIMIIKSEGVNAQL